MNLAEALGHVGADLRALLALFHAVLDLRGGFLCGSGAALCQVAHFVGHDGEAGPGLTGAGGFDGGIEGEDVRLEGDLVDVLKDLGNVLAGGFDGVHRREERFDSLGAGVGGLAGLDGGFLGVDGIVGVALGHAGHFFEGRAGFLEAGGLFTRALSQGLAGGGDLAGGSGNLFSASGDGVHHVAQNAGNAADNEEGDNNAQYSGGEIEDQDGGFGGRGGRLDSFGAMIRFFAVVITKRFGGLNQFVADLSRRGQPGLDFVRFALGAGLAKLECFSAVGFHQRTEFAEQSPLLRAFHERLILRGQRREHGLFLSRLLVQVLFLRGVVHDMLEVGDSQKPYLVTNVTSDLQPGQILLGDQIKALLDAHHFEPGERSKAQHHGHHDREAQC